MTENVQVGETVAQHIMRGYRDLEVTCRIKVGEFPLPQTETMDPVDIVSLMVQFFSSSYESQDYLPILRQYAKFQGINEEKLETVYPSIQTYITDVLRIIKQKEV